MLPMYASTRKRRQRPAGSFHSFGMLNAALPFFPVALLSRLHLITISLLSRVTGIGPIMSVRRGLAQHRSQIGKDETRLHRGPSSSAGNEIEENSREGRAAESSITGEKRQHSPILLPTVSAPFSSLRPPAAVQSFCCPQLLLMLVNQHFSLSYRPYRPEDRVTPLIGEKNNDRLRLSLSPFYQHTDTSRYAAWPQRRSCPSTASARLQQEQDAGKEKAKGGKKDRSRS